MTCSVSILIYRSIERSTRSHNKSHRSNSKSNERRDRKIEETRRRERARERESALETNLFKTFYRLETFDIDNDIQTLSLSQRRDALRDSHCQRLATRKHKKMLDALRTVSRIKDLTKFLHEFCFLLRIRVFLFRQHDIRNSRS